MLKRFPVKSSAIMLLVITFMFAAVTGCASKSKDDQDFNSDEINLKVTKEVLPNGLTILISENHKLPIFSYYTYYKVGGKFEKDGITGASHLLEHMMFKGAKKYGEGEFDKFIEGNGGKNNAYTTNDSTVYFENLPSQHLNKVIDIEADRMQNLLLEPSSFERERNVVLEERKLRYENSDRGKLFLNMMREVFKGTPYGTSVIGKIKDLKTVSRDEIFEYFKRFYAPNNAIIVIVGDVDTKKTIKEIKEKFGDIPQSEKLDSDKEEQLAKDGFDFKGKFNRHIKLKGQTPNPNFMLTFPAVKIGEKDGFVLDILASIIGGGESSYYSNKYVLTSKPVFSNIYAANYTLQNSGVFFVGGEILAGQSLNKTRLELLNNLKVICNESINERALQKVKNQYFIDMVSGLDTNAGVAKFIGDREFFYDDYRFYSNELQTYRSITTSELKTACEKYLVKDKHLFISIWNKN